MEVNVMVGVNVYVGVSVRVNVAVGIDVFVNVGTGVFVEVGVGVVSCESGIQSPSESDVAGSYSSAPISTILL